MFLHTSAVFSYYKVNYTFFDESKELLDLFVSKIKIINKDKWFLKLLQNLHIKQFILACIYVIILDFIRFIGTRYIF